MHSVAVPFENCVEPTNVKAATLWDSRNIAMQHKVPHIRYHRATQEISRAKCVLIVRASRNVVLPNASIS